MVKELTEKEMAEWLESSKKKEAMLSGKSAYEGEDIEGLMSYNNPAWKKYRIREDRLAERQAEIAKADKGLDETELKEVFRDIAGRWSATLLPRVGLVEAQKQGLAKYESLCESAGIKKVKKIERRQSRVLTEKKVTKKHEWTESEEKTLLGFVADLKNSLNRQVRNGVISQASADEQYQKSSQKIKEEMGLAKIELEESVDDDVVDDNYLSDIEWLRKEGLLV